MSILTKIRDVIRSLFYSDPIKKYGKSLRIITGIDDQGFCILRIHPQETKEYKWYDFKLALVDADFSSIELVTREGESLKIKESTHTGWYRLLVKIPERIAQFDKQTVTDFFDALQPCKVCGYKAVKGDDCKNCISKPWHDGLIEDYGTEEKYIKEEQLYHFSTDAEGEPIILDRKDGEPFQLSDNWQLLVTVEEVLSHSEKEVW